MTSWQRIGRAWQYVRRFEPARLRAAYTAAAGLALALGITIPADVDGRVTAVLAALPVILAALQGIATRAAVVPVATYKADVAVALLEDPPGRHAAGHIFDGSEQIVPRTTLGFTN